MQTINAFAIGGILALAGLFSQITPVGRPTVIVPNQPEFVRVTSTSPFTVPDGKKFMVTSAGSVFSGSNSVTTVTISFDTEVVGKTYISLNSVFEPSMTPWPKGLVAIENQIVQVSAADDAGIVLGTLTNM